MLTESVQIKEYLGKPFSEYDALEIPDAPSIPLLQWTTSLPDHSGFAFYNQTWFAIKGNEEGIPPFWVPRQSAVFLYATPTIDHVDASYPNTESLLSASIDTRNFLVSQFGLTRYFAVQGDQRNVLLAGMEQYARPKSPDIQAEYLELLRDLKIKYHRIPWTVVTDDLYRALL